MLTWLALAVTLVTLAMLGVCYRRNAVQQRTIVEPFCTIRRAGEATGLGRSMVNTICKQYAGDIEILLKPFTPDAFVTRLDDALDRRRPQPRT